MKDALMHFETIDADQIDDLMARREVRQPKDFNKKSNDSDNNSKSGSNSEGSTSKPEEEKKPEADLKNPTDLPAE